MKTINEIIKPIEQELRVFENNFRSILKSNIILLDTVVSYLVNRKGKRIRPVLTFLSAGLVGEINSRTHIGAAMVELLHTATLIHDDVVDEAMERRGFASINAKWNNKIAVLVGDFLLAKGLLIAIDNGETDFLDVLSESVRLMSEGELLQIQTSREEETDESRYFEIIYGKTASLVSACCEIGVLSVSSDITIRNTMKEFGRLVGLAFQIRDDIIDYIGKSSIVGKPIGNDIKERKITLPLIYALSNAPSDEAKKIVKQVKSKSKRKDIQRIVEFVIANNGVILAEMKAKKLIEKAKQLLGNFEDSYPKESLMKLADFVIEREK